MESGTLYLRLIPHVQCDEAERVWLERVLGQVGVGSLDRAAYQLLNLEMIKEPLPEVYRVVWGVLVGELRATVFSQVRLRTAMACLAVMGSHWAPALGLRGSIHKLVQDAVTLNARSPVYQVFLRAVDYRWEEMVKVGVGLGSFGSVLAMEMKVGEVTAQSARLWVSGTDAGAFGGLVLPGFLRGVMLALGVGEGMVEVEEEDDGWVALLVRWRRGGVD
jgi:hypothetical protein